MTKPAQAVNDIATGPTRVTPSPRLNQHVSMRIWSYGRGQIVAAVCGIWLAAGSALFAGYMLTHLPQEPLVNGMQDLAIFGMPNGSVDRRRESSVLQRAARGDPNEIDFAGTGSIPEASTSQLPALGFPAAGGPISVIAGDRNVVWLRRGSVIIAAHVGDLVPGAGYVAGIERRGEGWEPIGANGAPLVDDAVRPLGSVRGGKRFSRELIFGDN